jgi:hypothetical protein
MVQSNLQYHIDELVCVVWPGVVPEDPPALASVPEFIETWIPRESNHGITPQKRATYISLLRQTLASISVAWYSLSSAGEDMRLLLNFLSKWTMCHQSYPNTQGYTWAESITNSYTGSNNKKDEIHHANIYAERLLSASAVRIASVSSTSLTTMISPLFCRVTRPLNTVPLLPLWNTVYMHLGAS